MLDKLDLSSSLEDYLEAIYLLTRDHSAAHANDIAARLNVTKSSVSWALNQLADKGLIHYEPYTAVTLTDTGLRLAQRLSQRHDEIKTFLTDVLAINEDVAQQNACRMEHVIDPHVLRRMKTFMDFLRSCPRAGLEWMKGFGFYCLHGRNHDNCLDCLQRCQNNIDPQKALPDDDTAPLAPDRDQHILDRLIAVLEESGRSLSENQQKVIQVFMNLERHSSLDDLHQLIRTKHPRVTLADVQIALDVLCEHKCARPVRFDQQIVYEHFHPESHHDHLFCVKCGSIFEFYDPRIERLQIENARRSDFRLLRHNLNIYGVCNDCIRKEASSRTLDTALAGEVVRIVRVVADNLTQQRLLEMGLKPDTIVEILNDRSVGSNLILMIGHQRLMLDRDTARKIRIVNTDPALAPHFGRHRHRHRHGSDRPDHPHTSSSPSLPE